MKWQMSWVLVLALWLPQARAIEVVTLYGDESYPPYSYVEAGEFKGIYVDLLKQASELMPAYRLELKPVPWKRGLAMLKNGEAMGLFPPYAFYERGYMVPYSAPLNLERIVLMCHPAVMKQPRRVFPADFLRLNIGVNRGFLLAKALQQAAKEKKIRLDEAGSNEANLRKLAARRIDCYANDELSIRYTLNALQQERDASAAIKALQPVKTVTLMEQTAHVGFGAYFTPAYKADFINQLNAAIVEAQRKNSMAK